MSEASGEVLDIPESFDEGFSHGFNKVIFDETQKDDSYYVTGYKFGQEARLKSEVDASEVDAGPHTHEDFEAGFHAGLADSRASAAGAANVDKNEQYKSGYFFGYDPRLLSNAKRDAATRVSTRVALRKGGKTTRRKRKRSKKSKRRKQKN